MGDPRARRSREPQAVLRQVIARLPAIVRSVNQIVSGFVDTAPATLQGLVATDADVDALLEALVEQIVTGSAPQADATPESDVVEDLVRAVARHLVGEARGAIVRRLVAMKQN